MSESFIQLPTDSSGKKVRTELIGSVHEQVIRINAEFTEKRENNANGQPLYIGQAQPGTLTSATGWRIQKYTYDANFALTDVEWAEGTNAFDKIWDDRATYTYS